MQHLREAKVSMWTTNFLPHPPPMWNKDISITQEWLIIGEQKILCSLSFVSIYEKNP